MFNHVLRQSDVCVDFDAYSKMEFEHIGSMECRGDIMGGSTVSLGHISRTLLGYNDVLFVREM